MAEMHIEYVRKPPASWAGLVSLVLLIAAPAATAAVGLTNGQIAPLLCWLLLAWSVMLAALVLIRTVIPSVVETRVSATAEEIKVHFPWRRTRIIPFAAVSKLIGVASGSGSYGDGVDFKVHWNGQSITLDEELVFKSGLYGKLNMPGFDEAAYQKARQHKLRGLELFTGREFLLWNPDSRA